MNWEFLKGLQWIGITTPEKFVIIFCKPMKTMSSVARALQLKQTKASLGKENITRADGWMESGCFGAQCGTQKSVVFFTTFENRTTDTLVNIIKQHIKPGSTIISDCWKAYNSLDKEGFTHLTVNHSVNFVDPNSGAHTNTIESTWSALKKSLLSNGTQKTLYDIYFSKYCIKKLYLNDSTDPFTRFLEIITKVYPGNFTIWVQNFMDIIDLQLVFLKCIWQ